MVNPCYLPSGYPGGPEAYVGYVEKVWSTNGNIALLVFARATDVKSGAFEFLRSNSVNLGAR